MQKEVLDDQSPIMLINGLQIAKATQNILYREGIALKEYLELMQKAADLEQEAEYKILGKAIDRLSGRERKIIMMRFGIGTKDGEEKTQKEVADILGISQSYISRLEKKIISKLKIQMENND